MNNNTYNNLMQKYASQRKNASDADSVNMIYEQMKNQPGAAAAAPYFPAAGTVGGMIGGSIIPGALGAGVGAVVAGKGKRWKGAGVGALVGGGAGAALGGYRGYNMGAILRDKIQGGLQQTASAEDRRELCKRANGLTDKVANVADMAKKWISNNPEIAIGAGVGGVGGAVAGGAAKGFKGAVAGGLGGAVAGGAAGYGYKKYQAGQDTKKKEAASAKGLATIKGEASKEETAESKRQSLEGNGPTPTLPDKNIPSSPIQPEKK